MSDLDAFALSDEQRERLRALHAKMVDRFLEEADPDSAPKAQGDRYYHRRAVTELARNIEALSEILDGGDAENRIAELEAKLKAGIKR